MKRNLLSTLIVTLFCLLVGIPRATALTPIGSAFTYQGHLNDGGSPANGSYDFEFKLYDAASSGSQVGGTVTKEDVAVAGGRFTVELDFGDVFDGAALWLDIGVRPGSSSGAYTPLNPRQALTPAPFALYALSAESAPWNGLDGVPAGFADGVDDQGGLSLPFAGTVSSSDPAFSITNNGSGGAVYGSSSTLFGVYGLAASGSSASAYGVYGQSDSSSGRGVYGTTTATSGVNYGVYGRSPSTNGVGVYGRAEAGSGLTYGVYGSSASTNGRGVYGVAKYGVYGQSDSTAGFGVYGNATANSGTTYGVYGQSVAPNGVGVLGTHGAAGGGAGVQAQSSASGGRGLLALATANSGVNYGVYARTNSPDGYGVYATNASTGPDFTPDLVLGGSGSSDNGNLFSDPALASSDLLFFSNDELWFYLDNNDDEAGSFQIQAGGGGSNPVFKVDESGNVFADGTYSTPAADFAELLPATPNLKPGEVVVIGSNGVLTRSTQAYQPNVVGVYSTQPGYLGGGRHLGRDGYVPLAVIGVVPVKASAENGSIQPGDLLAASSTPGHAMRCEGVERCFGRTIGKALAGLDEETGVIQMLVVLQ